MRGPAALGLLALALLLQGSAGALLPPLPGAAPCEVPGSVGAGLQRVAGGPDAIMVVAFDVPAEVTGRVEVWFALRAHTANPSWPSERATAAGFLERADGAELGRLGGSLGIYPYGVAADAGALGVRAGPAELGCWGAFGFSADLTLAPGSYRLVVLGASEAGSRFAAFLPPGVAVTGVASGPAQRLDAGTMSCVADARAFASGVLVEVLADCSTPLRAEGRSYRALIATWGPTQQHDVRWRAPDGSALRCYKAPGWCADVGSGPPGDWVLEVPRYVTVHQPSPFIPVGADGYSGVFGVFAGLP